MLIALSIIAALALMGMLVATVFVTVTFRQALRDVARDRMRDSERRDAQLSAVLDRFQAIRWEDLAAMRSIEEPLEGAFLTPDEQRAEFAGVTVEEAGTGWGPLRRLRELSDQEEAEKKLLEEDFPEEERA